MDGHAILAGRTRCYARPWLGCLPIEQLTKDNLPPFYVRLQDDQVGHLAFWVGTSRDSITRLKLGQVWPWDFDAQGKISSRRETWGAEYCGSGKERGKGLGGGKEVPTWTDPGLPLTYTSSHKVMAAELEVRKRGAALKRKAEEDAGRSACMPVKKPRLGNMGTELKRMKENAEKTRQKDQATDIKKERYAGAKPELREAVQVVDTLMRSARDSENQNATLETMLLKNEARYVEDTNGMFDEWLAYNTIKRLEVDRIHEDHAMEIKSRDAKIEALETEAKGSRARLEKEKQKVRTRDERLTQVKSRWAQEQNLMERKLREIEEIACDLDKLSEFDHDSDESEDRVSYNEIEPEEPEKEAVEVKETEEMKRVKEAKAKQKQESKEPKEPAAKGPTDKELKKSVDQERVKSMDPKKYVHLDETEDDEDEGPIVISRQRKAKLKKLDSDQT